ncbi:MAG: hypothetical protein HUU20_27895, partial [Pirellulales bacterium]|nr:hypothetical protein [Pirellulales bacterium]
MNPAEATAGSTLVDRFARLWQESQSHGPPDVRAFVQGHAGLPLRELADLLLVDQTYRWQTGCPITAEQYLETWPDVAADPELRLDLVYGEYRARSARNLPVDPAAFVRRFPDLGEALSRQVEVAISESDVVLMVVDAFTGPTDYDQIMARMILHLDKPHLLVVNKIDGDLDEAEAA